jgi:peroxiredoxin Q/BCP
LKPWLRLRPGLKVGDAAPGFDLLDQDGRRHRLEDYRGRWLVVFFYPKDNTPGCIREACRFGDDYDQFRALGAEVLGVSGDGSESHQRFREGCRLRYQLLSDPGRVLREDWGLPHFFRRLDGRSTFVLDPAGIVRFVHNRRTRAEDHPVRALAFLQSQATPPQR